MMDDARLKEIEGYEKGFWTQRAEDAVTDLIAEVRRLRKALKRVLIEQKDQGNPYVEDRFNLREQNAGLLAALDAALLDGIYWDNDPITTPQLMKLNGDVGMETSVQDHNADIERAKKEFG